MATARDTDTHAFFALILELLPAMAGGRVSEIHANRLLPGVDALLASAEWRLFAPLVVLLLSTRGAGGRPLPPEVGLHLRREAARTVAVDLSRQALVSRLGVCLREERVAVILLKAAALTGWVYPAEAPRIGCDLDLLVRPEDRSRLAAALAGFAEERDKFPGRPNLARLAYEWSYWTQGRPPTEFDVHSALCYPALYPIDYPALWARSRPHPAYEVEELRVPSPEDMLLHLALHALHDLKDFSRHDVDAALMIRTQVIDWDLLIDNGRAWGLEAAAFFLLERSARNLGAAVPDRVLDALCPGPLGMRIGRWVLRSGASQTGRGGESNRRLRQLVSQLAMTGLPWCAAKFEIDYLRARILDAIGIDSQDAA